VFVALAHPGPVRAGDELIEARAKLYADLALQAEDLARFCDQSGLADEAKKTRSWVEPPDPRRLVLVLLPVERDEPVPPDSPPGVIEWDRRFRELRTAHADEMFQLARGAIRSRRASLAFQLAVEAAWANPDLEPARKLLGYRPYQDEWHTSFEIERLRRGQVWHHQFGWLPADSLPRYEAGERYLERERKWITAEEDAARRTSIDRGWDVQTEHYRVRTDHSLEAGVELAARLERLFRVWQQAFVRFYASERDVEQLFQGRALARAARPLQVTYFKNEDEYQQALSAWLPAGVKTTGIYLADQKQAYFYAREGDDFGTLYHEATHQLFHESRPASPLVGRRANFWIIEGIACYMESLVEHDGYATLGGSDAVRYLDARHRVVEDSFYVPLAELCGLGMEGLQQDPRIARLYSQSAGLAHFLVHHQNGRYRDALLGYLSVVYSGQDVPATLAQQAGVGFDILDRQYREFLEEAP
jgi:hypothetical protein